jgi:hypothetical protein
MLRHVALVRTDVSEERIASINRITRISELRKTLAVISNCEQLPVTAILPSSLILFTQIMEAIRSSETSIPTRALQRHIPEGGILTNVSYFEPD